MPIFWIGYVSYFVIEYITIVRSAHSIIYKEWKLCLECKPVNECVSSKNNLRRNTVEHHLKSCIHCLIRIHLSPLVRKDGLYGSIIRYHLDVRLLLRRGTQALLRNCISRNIGDGRSGSSYKEIWCRGRNW
jgi:hypothetical protein